VLIEKLSSAEETRAGVTLVPLSFTEPRYVVDVMLATETGQI